MVRQLFYLLALLLTASGMFPSAQADEGPSPPEEPEDSSDGNQTADPSSSPQNQEDVSVCGPLVGTGPVYEICRDIEPCIYQSGYNGRAAEPHDDKLNWDTDPEELYFFVETGGPAVDTRDQEFYVNGHNEITVAGNALENCPPI